MAAIYQQNAPHELFVRRVLEAIWLMAAFLRDGSWVGGSSRNGSGADSRGGSARSCDGAAYNSCGAKVRRKSAANDVAARLVGNGAAKRGHLAGADCRARQKRPIVSDGAGQRETAHARLNKRARQDAVLVGDSRESARNRHAGLGRLRGGRAGKRSVVSSGKAGRSRGRDAGVSTATTGQQGYAGRKKGRERQNANQFVHGKATHRGKTVAPTREPCSSFMYGFFKVTTVSAQVKPLNPKASISRKV